MRHASQTFSRAWLFTKHCRIEDASAEVAGRFRKAPGGAGDSLRRAELPADPCWISLQVDLESGVTFFLAGS